MLLFVLDQTCCEHTRVCIHQPFSRTFLLFFPEIFSPLPAKPNETLGLRSVCLSVHPSVCPTVRQSVSISFPDFFLKRLHILTSFLAWKSITMFYRSSLSFVTLHRFLAKLRALDLENFSNQTVLWTF